MKSLWKWGMLGVFSLSLMMGTTACSDDDPDYSNVTPPEVASVASTIGGIVSDRSGDAIAGAKVTLTGSSSQSTQTGDDGVYLFEEVPPGTYTVLVEADGKVSEEGTVTVANSEQTQRYIWNVSLNADQEEQIAVSVTDETSGSVNTETLKGNEIAGVEMTAVVPADAVTGVEEGEEAPSVKERVNVAMKESRQIMLRRYSEAIGRLLHPSITILFTVLAVLGMIFGMFNFGEHPFLTIVFAIIAILAFIGMTTKKFKQAFNTSYEGILEKYKKAVQFFIQKKVLSTIAVIASIVLLVLFMNTTPTGMVPNEDTGTIMGSVTLPPGTSQERAREVLAQVDSLIGADPAVQSRTVISGFSFIGSGQGPSYGSIIIKLKDWSERSMTQSSDIVVASLFMRSQKLFKDAQVLFFAPPMIPGYSISTDIELNMQDKTGGDLNRFFEIVNSYNAALEERPEINSARTNFNPSFPQYQIDIDAAACKKAGISPSDILTTMQGYFGGIYASNFNSFGKMFRVMIQAEPNATKNLESLNRIKVRGSDGEMAPITQFVSFKKIYGPDVISRFNLYTSIQVMVSPAAGYTSGQALQAIAEVADQNLPAGFDYELGGMAREEAQTTNTTAIIFVLCLVFVYLLLSAQYESYMLPLAVLLSVPFGLLGSFLFVNGMNSLGSIPALKMIMGSMSNDIYMQIALIMLMGLLAKNAILIVEFALDRRKMGMSLTWAAVLGAGARLRPILMTSLAMIIGLLPLMFAFGVGAHGNRTLGASAIGGMLIGMICQIFIVPVLFVAFQYLQEKIKPIEWTDLDNSDMNTEIEQYAHTQKIDKDEK